MSERAENTYKQLARERQAAALRGKEKAAAEHALSAGADRLFRWRGTRSKWDRKYAARALGWAEKAIQEHCG